MVADWRQDYNDNRPHSSLHMMAPARFARQWRQSAAAGKEITQDDIAEDRRSPHSAPTTAAGAIRGDQELGASGTTTLGVSLRSPSGLPPRDAEPTATTLQPPTHPRLSQQVDR